LPDKRGRRSIRLRGYDYAQPAAYFVTVCTRNHTCLFGHVVNGEMHLNEAGEMVRSVWDRLRGRFPSVEPDAFVVMPNHVHGIIAFVGAGLALPEDKSAASSAPTLADVVRAFKSLSAIQVNRRLMRSGSLWLRNYYEHVVRNEQELTAIREYIQANPALWDDDENNPAFAEGDYQG
jgi:putative transposase